MIGPGSDRESHARRGGSKSRFLPAIVVIVVGCATNTGVEPTTTVVAIESTTTSTIIAATSTTSAETTTTAPIDAAAVVAASLAASSANYRFTSVVLVGEQILTTISGVVDGNSVAADIGTGSGEVSYVRTPEGEWITGTDGKWVELDGEPPAAPPLGALVDAGGLVVESGDGSTGIFTGMLGPAAGAAQGLAFTLTVEGGLVTEIRYEADTGGEMAQVITTLGDIGSAGTVSAPDGL